MSEGYAFTVLVRAPAAHCSGSLSSLWETKVRRRSLMRVAVGALGVACILAWSAGTPASAAPGVTGRLEHASIEQNYTTCTSGHCYNYFFLVATGWAYNGSTRPSQEVFVRFRSDKDNGGYVASTSAFVANHSRPAIAKKNHLHTANVGYSIAQAQGKDLWNGGPGLACAYARDRGTAQAWRQAGCVRYTVTD